MEDSATVTSVLIPWNSCGMTQSTVLKVPTVDYLPYCIFNIISPLMSIAVALIGLASLHGVENACGNTDKVGCAILSLNTCHGAGLHLGVLAAGHRGHVEADLRHEGKRTRLHLGLCCEARQHEGCHQEYLLHTI